MNEDDARFAQIFVVGDAKEEEVKQQIKNIGQDLDHNILQDWQNFLSKSNPDVKTYRVARDIIGNNIEQMFALKTLEGRKLSQSTYNFPKLPFRLSRITLPGSFSLRGAELAPKCLSK
ncbi:hypothetical protein O181_124349 [Austropuccinia psidii MF-1]|uniref:Uncharacterized protein n=1 Tax=Austropuccinia psidii MF-1 TaxID=1389203 RepID=A0A9Q3KRZ3_9BASI|nr:hypothetical protein [Austropuccinia psidii MF-1]